MTATDGRRMAHVENELEFTEEFALVIPAETVKIIFSLLAKEDDADIGIAVGAERISFTAASWQVASTVVAGKYPAWRRVVPVTVAHMAKLNRNTFIEGLERAALAADLGTMRVVEVRLENGKVTFAAKNEMTSAKIEVPNCVLSDDAVKSFKVDPQLVIDALKAIDDDSFTLDYSAGFSAIVFKCSIPWLAVVMPLHEK
jgi:DNA polymerase-3 subunit beta